MLREHEEPPSSGSLELKYTAVGLAAPVGATTPSQPTHPVQMGPQNKAKDYRVPYSRHRLTTGGLQLPYGRSSGY